MTLAPRFFSGVAMPAGGISPGERADVVVEGLEQAGPSFEVRVLVNDVPAGSVYVYGEGAPAAEIGSAAHPRKPMTRHVIATEAVSAAAAAGPEATVTLVPVGFGGAEPEVDLDGVSVSVVVEPG